MDAPSHRPIAPGRQVATEFTLPPREAAAVAETGDWRSRWLSPSAVFVAAVVLAGGGVYASLRTARGSTDLGGFHAVWQCIWQGVEPSADVADATWRYPPAFCALFAPLGALPRWAVGLIWYVVTIAAGLGGLWLSRRLLLGTGHDLSSRRERVVRRALLLAAAGVAAFFLDNVALGQNAPLLILLVLAAFVAASEGRRFLAGALIGLAAVIKVLPAIFLLPFLVRRDLRALTGCACAVVIACLGIGGAVFGWRGTIERHMVWLDEVIDHDDSRPEDPRDRSTLTYTVRYHNQSLPAVLARLMLPVNAGRTDRPMHVQAVSCHVATWRLLKTIATALVLLLTVLALLSRAAMEASPGPDGSEVSSDSDSATTSHPAGGEQNRLVRMPAAPGAYDAAVCSLALLLLSPLVWLHYMLWGFLPLAYVACGAFSGEHDRLWQWPVGFWILAEVGSLSPWLRAVGVNFWATLVLFGMLTVPESMRALRRMTVQIRLWRASLGEA